jgi:hypothetical protein
MAKLQHSNGRHFNYHGKTATFERQTLQLPWQNCNIRTADTSITMAKLQQNTWFFKDETRKEVKYTLSCT